VSAGRAEIGRKAVHLATAVLPACMAWAPEPWAVRGPVLAFCIVLILDLARFVVPAFGRWTHRWVGTALRPGEHRGLVSVHYLTGAAALLALVVPRAIGAAAMAYLVFGDAAAALVGRRFGRHRIGTKSLEGSVAGFLAASAAGLVFLAERPLVAIAGAAVATLVEALPLPVDDNWSVPLASAAFLAACV